MSNDQNSSDAQAVIAAMETYHAADTLDLPDGSSVVVLPKGMSLHSLKQYEDERRAAPERVRGTARLESVESFVDYVKAFAGLESKLFATQGKDDIAAPELVAIIDHHGKGPEVKPQFCTHRAEYTFPLSDEWKAWAGVDGDWLDQAKFAAFLEDHATDVIPGNALPDSSGIAQAARDLGFDLATPARLIELSRGLSVRVDKRAAQTVNLQTGEAQLLFSEAHNDDSGQPLRVPGGFAIAIPVFRSGVLFPLFVRLRYRVGSGKVGWSFCLHRPDHVFQAAFRKGCELARDATALPLFYGTPEV